MMNNLFSIFDPSSSFKSVWLLLFMLIILVPMRVWNTNSHSISAKGILFLLKEISFTLKGMKKGELLFVLSLFMSIFYMNIIALFPQVFSLTSHVILTLPLAMISWLVINLFGWLKNSNHMLSHLVPQGTPMALMSFMVLIELTSSLIRPITLCVRLTANMIAGHLLMTLLGNAMMNLPFICSLTFLMAPLILTILETAVAVIQAYVFMTLVTLYVTEIK